MTSEVEAAGELPPPSAAGCAAPRCLKAIRALSDRRLGMRDEKHMAAPVEQGSGPFQLGDRLAEGLGDFRGFGHRFGARSIGLQLGDDDYKC